jgi:hypothetical protein
MRAVHLVELVLLDPSDPGEPPTGGTPIDRPGPIVSDSGIDYSNLGFGSADFDFDSDVDGHDFLIWQRGLGTTNAIRLDGNANDGEDGDVDGGDLALWQATYGAAAATGAAGAVPEPGAAGLALLAAGALARAARRRTAWRRAVRTVR